MREIVQSSWPTGRPLLAAAAASIGARLATGNPKDFPMTEIDVVHWPAGE